MMSFRDEENDKASVLPECLPGRVMVTDGKYRMAKRGHYSEADCIEKPCPDQDRTKAYPKLGLSSEEECRQVCTCAPGYDSHGHGICMAGFDADSTLPSLDNYNLQQKARFRTGRVTLDFSGGQEISKEKVADILNSSSWSIDFSVKLHSEVKGPAEAVAIFFGAADGFYVGLTGDNRVVVNFGRGNSVATGGLAWRKDRAYDLRIVVAASKVLIYRNSALVVSGKSSPVALTSIFLGNSYLPGGVAVIPVSLTVEQLKFFNTALLAVTVAQETETATITDDTEEPTTEADAITETETTAEVATEPVPEEATDSDNITVVTVWADEVYTTVAPATTSKRNLRREEKNVVVTTGSEVQYEWLFVIPGVLALLLIIFCSFPKIKLWLWRRSLTVEPLVKVEDPVSVVALESTTRAALTVEDVHSLVNMTSVLKVAESAEPASRELEDQAEVMPDLVAVSLEQSDMDSVVTGQCHSP